MPDPKEVESRGVDIDPIDKTSLLEFIDFELNRLRAESLRPGWSPWALWGVIALLCWKLVDTFDPKLIHGLLLTTIALEALFLAGSSSLRALSARPTNILHAPRFINANTQFSGTRQTFILSILFYSAIFYYILTATDLFVWSRLAGLVTFGCVAIAWITVVAIISMPDNELFFIPYRSRKKYQSVWQYISYGIGVALAIAFPSFFAFHSFHSLPSDSDETLSIIKSSLLLFALIRVLGILSTVSSNNILNEHLVDIRREVVRNRLKPEIACRLVDMMVAGLPTIDLLRNRSNETIKKTVEMANMIAKARKRLDCLLDENGNFVSSTDLRIVDSVLTAFDSDLIDLDNAMTELTNHQKKLNKFVSRIISSGGDPKDIEQMQTELSEAISELVTETEHTNNIASCINAEVKAIRLAEGNAEAVTTDDDSDLH